MNNAHHFAMRKQEEAAKFTCCGWLATYVKKRSIDGNMDSCNTNQLTKYQQEAKASRNPQGFVRPCFGWEPVARDSFMSARSFKISSCGEKWVGLGVMRLNVYLESSGQRLHQERCDQIETKKVVEVRQG